MLKVMRLFSEPKMTKIIKKQDEEEEVINLAEQVRAILIETVFSASLTLIEGKHKVGQEIVEDPLYKKWGKGTGKLIQTVAQKIGRSEQDLYLCVQFYQKYPDISNVFKAIKSGSSKKVTWADVKRLLSGKPKECQHEWEEKKHLSCKLCSCKKFGV